IDGEGNLADINADVRNKAVENHYKWVEAANFLGCKSIRVNAAGKGTPEEMKNAAVDSLGKLSTVAKDYKINVIVEYHGGLSSDGQWLSSILKQVGMKNCGSLPDFGKFYEYYRYQGVADLMPFAKGGSASTHYFDEEGYESKIDYVRVMTIVEDARYKGSVGIDYEGGSLSVEERIIRSEKLLEMVGEGLSYSFFVCLCDTI